MMGSVHDGVRSSLALQAFYRPRRPNERTVGDEPSFSPEGTVQAHPLHISPGTWFTHFAA